MANLPRNFVIRCRRSGISPSVIGLGALAVLSGAALISGIAGVAFTLSLALAFLLGTAARPGPFHLRSLATATPEHPLDRTGFEQALARTFDASGAGLCIVLQIDGAEALRARHGTRAMDQIARHMAERLFAEVRQNDFIADLGAGGDCRMAVYLSPSPRMTLESGVQTCLRLQAALARGMSVDRMTLHLTASVGFCLTTRLPAGFTAAELIDAADAALAEAGREGPRALRAFDRTLARPAKVSQAERGSAPDMAAALEAGQIEPWFQPQICTDTGALTGIEALARWRHPDRGILGPGDFLPAIRDQGLSCRLTETMLNRSIEQLGHWDHAGIHVPRVSINLGSEDLADPTLADRIAWTLDRYGLPPVRLVLEVLETVIARADPDDMAARNLLALGEMGCQIDLDDFGTGSASISGIRRFAVHRIKIDRSLVTAVDTDPDQHAMIAAILTMAGQLGVEVLGEGVETPGEYAALSQLGCQHVQGYAIARPMASPDLIAWVLRRGERAMPALPKPLRRDATTP